MSHDFATLRKAFRGWDGLSKTYQQLVSRPVIAFCNWVNSPSTCNQPSEVLPYTTSLSPAKSTVFLPLVCCTNAEGAARWRTGRLAFAARAKLLCWMRGLLSCLNELRRALLAYFEAIAVVKERFGSWWNSKCPFLLVTPTKPKCFSLPDF